MSSNLRSQLTEKISGIGRITSASIISVTHDTLHANLISGFVGINITLGFQR